MIQFLCVLYFLTPVPILGFHFNKIDPDFHTCYPVGHHPEILMFLVFFSLFVCLFVCV